MASAIKKRGKYVVEVAPGVPGSGDKPSVGATYRNITAEKEFENVEGACTLYETFERSVKQFSANECLGWRENGQGPFVWSTYQVITNARRCMALVQVASLNCRNCTFMWFCEEIAWPTVLGKYLLCVQAVGAQVTAVASAMVHAGLTAHGRAGIYSVNSPEWMTVMQVLKAPPALRAL